MIENSDFASASSRAWMIKRVRYSLSHQLWTVLFSHHLPEQYTLLQCPSGKRIYLILNRELIIYDMRWWAIIRICWPLCARHIEWYALIQYSTRGYSTHCIRSSTTLGTWISYEYDYCLTLKRTALYDYKRVSLDARAQSLFREMVCTYCIRSNIETFNKKEYQAAKQLLLSMDVLVQLIRICLLLVVIRVVTGLKRSCEKALSGSFSKTDLLVRLLDMLVACI